MAFSGCSTEVGGPGWSSEGLSRADTLARGHGGQGWGGWIGRRRQFGWNLDARGPVLSITKALAALAATRAAGEKWLSADERVAETVPEWRSDPNKSRITVLMLLQQTAGLEAGVAALYRNPGDKGKRALGLRIIDTPGTKFRYGPACWEVLAELLHRKLVARGQTLEKFLDRSVLAKVGISSPAWRSDRLGRFYLSTGAELSVEDLARLGRTLGKLLEGDNADGFEASQFARMTEPSRINPMFGGGLWRNVNARKGGAFSAEIEDALDPAPPTAFWQRACLSTIQPAEMVALIGSSGRRVFIWPSEHRVVARLGRARSWEDGPFLRELSAWSR